MINTILLTIIAISEVSRLILTHKKQSKKAHFVSKLEGVEKMIHDLEFKVFKTKEIREDIRREYDAMQSRIASYEESLKTAKGEEKSRIEDEKTRAERDRDRFLTQIKAIDNEINGVKPNAENPDGAHGINDQIDSLRELEVMLKSWIKTL